MAQKRPGHTLKALGPLGKPFTQKLKEKKRVLVAGGVGVPPLVFLAERLRERGTKDERRRTKVLIGAKTKDSILCEKEFRDLGCEVRVATDDGSRGFKGYVSNLLKKELSTIDYRILTIYACGPIPMLKEISRISLEHTIPAQLSLESHMACGIGACMGCVIKTRDVERETKDVFEYKRVCKEGPVFEAGEIIW